MASGWASLHKLRDMTSKICYKKAYEKVWAIFISLTNQLKYMCKVLIRVDKSI